MAHSESTLCSSVGSATFGLQSIYKTHFTSAGDEMIRALYGSELNRPQSGGETITVRDQRNKQRQQQWCLKKLSLPRHPWGLSKPLDKIDVCADCLVFTTPFFLLFKLCAVLHIKDGTSLFLILLSRHCLHWWSWAPARVILDSSARPDLPAGDVRPESGSPTQLGLDMWRHPQRLHLRS